MWGATITRYWVDLLLATVVHRPVSGLQKIYIPNNGYPFEIQFVSLIAKIACAYEYVWRGKESVVHPKNFAVCFDFNWESVLSICFRITSLSLGYLLSTQHWFRWWFGADQMTSHYLKQWWHRVLYNSFSTTQSVYLSCVQYITRSRLTPVRRTYVVWGLHVDWGSAYVNRGSSNFLILLLLFAG